LTVPDGATFESHNESLAWYIFLGGDAVRTEDELRPDRKYRDDLLSNDAEKIDRVLKQILPDEFYTDEYLNRIRATYRQRLRDILGDDGKYTGEQRLSATLALDKLDQRERKPLEPETVRVPGRDYSLGGKNEDYVLTAKDAGIQLSLTKENQAWYSAYPPDFRIGRYLVTNEEFARFTQWAKAHDERI